jgi:hypothetical protein
MSNTITISSCFYIINSKFPPEIYIGWMNNFLSIVNNFNLIIYTDKNSVKYINKGANHNIKIIIKEIEQFYNYKYKDYWIKNHEKNYLINDKSCWELNMLWSEKISFVNETIKNKYFDTEFYAWCDIGYFRNRNEDLNTDYLIKLKWPNVNTITNFNKNKIYYGCINNDDNYLNSLYKLINNKNNLGLPIVNIPPYQNSIAGGFFIIHKDKIDWWLNTYDSKLKLYFKNDYLVKDDQIIIIDCIYSKLSEFMLFRENNIKFDNWFMFQRILC